MIPNDVPIDQGMELAMKPGMVCLVGLVRYPGGPGTYRLDIITKEVKARRTPRKIVAVESNVPLIDPDTAWPLDAVKYWTSVVLCAAKPMVKLPTERRFLRMADLWEAHKETKWRSTKGARVAIRKFVE